MKYQIMDGTVSLGGKTVLSHFNFEIKGSEKIALVGKNGAGKTTLLRLVAGEITLERDDRRSTPGIVADRKLSIGMLRQQQNFLPDQTVEELVLACSPAERYSKEHYLYQMEYERMFTGFGFSLDERGKRLAEFSGGQQTKIALIKLLLEKPDILLLDEPTNHLDLRTVEWLETYLREYPKAVLFVSHDRFFIDRTAGAVYEIADGALKRYAGNYTEYRKQKRAEIERERKEYERQQRERERLNGLVERFKHKPKKAAFARSRKTMLERMERMEKPREEDAHFFTGKIEPKVLGSKLVYEAERLAIGYGKPLLTLSFRIKRGAKIAVIGENGVGKSTFLKTVAGELSPLDGRSALGEGILLGYFDQQTAVSDSAQTVYDHFRKLFPSLTDREVRSLLGAYLFCGRDTAKRVRDLSGGERSRLILAELLCSGPNFMVLDEPTNHMDIPAKETLESAFSSYTGTILFVSHDRYFISQVADAVLVFEDGAAMYYPFGYAHYLEKCRRSGENPQALLSAENQAMLEKFDQVPKKERHETRPLSTEEAYVDWRLRLAAEPMREKKARVELLWEEISALEEDAASYGSDGNLTPRAEKERERLQEMLDIAWGEWNAACLSWGGILFEDDLVFKEAE